MTASPEEHRPVQVSVSVVTYNGAEWLPGCLASLDAQEAVRFEVFVWDNASRDDSLHIIREWAAGRDHVFIKPSDTNVGYSVAHDHAIARSGGDYVLLLNQDVELDPGFLAAAVAAFEARPQVGSVQGRLRQLGGPGTRLETIDTTGLSMSRDRRAISRGQGQPDGAAHMVAGPVWGVDGPAPVYRSAALEAARLPRSGGGWEYLDEDFFLYKEDVDLAWRLRLLGWEAWYAPTALAWHARGTGITGASGLLETARANRTIAPAAAALSWRNQRLMQIKNEDLLGYLRDLPWIARRELLSWVYILMFDPRRLRAVADLARAAPQAMRKRRSRQRLAASRRRPRSRDPESAGD